MIIFQFFEIIIANKAAKLTFITELKDHFDVVIRKTTAAANDFHCAHFLFRQGFAAHLHALQKVGGFSFALNFLGSVNGDLLGNRKIRIYKFIKSGIKRFIQSLVLGALRLPNGLQGAHTLARSRLFSRTRSFLRGKRHACRFCFLCIRFCLRRRGSRLFGVGSCRFLYLRQFRILLFFHNGSFPIKMKGK